MSLKNKRVLVTGAGGFIGKHLCKALFKEDASIVGLVRVVAHNKYLSEQYAVDILDKAKTKKIIKDVQPDFVVHLAANKNRGVDAKAYREGYETNFIGSRNLIEACQSLVSLSRFVFLGSSDEYGQLPVPFVETVREAPVNAYGASKLAVTHMLQTLARSNGFPCVILRPTIAYGPAQDIGMFLPAMITTLVAGNMFEMSPGAQTRDFVYIDDLIDAILRALVVPDVLGNLINVSSAIPIRISELSRMTAKMITSKSEHLLAFGARNYRSGEAMHYWATNLKAKQMLEWQPTIQLEEGLRKTIDYFQAARIKSGK